MAPGGEELDDYESDPEDAIVPSAMRRREASDDEEDDDGSDGRKDRTAAIGSDGDSDGQGAAPAYEEEDDEEYEEEDEVVEGIEEEEEEKGKKDLEGSKRDENGDGDGETKEEEEGEKKENEPYAVPTAGAFYMHDDRFQENGRGRHRRMPGGRRLWESKDDRAWVHDRFEEMKLQDAHYKEGRRNSRGHFRGRGGGRTRGAGRGGYVKGNRPRGYNDSGNNQTHALRTMRGRGPRRYEPRFKTNEVAVSQHKQPAKSQESMSNTSVARPSSQPSNVQLDPALTRKQVFASSLNSASPPFYPSGSSKQEISATSKRDLQSGSTGKTVSTSMQMENTYLPSQSGSLLRGKTVVDSMSNETLYANNYLHSVAGKTLANGQVQSSGSTLTSSNANHSRVQGRSLSMNAPSNFQPTSSLSPGVRVSAQFQPSVQMRPQSQFQPSLKVSTQQRPVIGNQVSSPPHVPSTNSSVVREANSPPGSSKSTTQLIGKGKTSNQGAGKGSFVYSGAQVIGTSGAMSLGHNDQNFSATPALLPVMQFGGQHHGGIPAVGMALPGYVAQPQLGFGNSEMTWVPVLAGASGALGASYPYIALDGSYYPRPSGQASSSVASGREASAPKPASALRPPQRSEIVNDEFGQRQNKPRRYSEMNFGQ